MLFSRDDTALARKRIRAQMPFARDNTALARKRIRARMPFARDNTGPAPKTYSCTNTFLMRQHPPALRVRPAAERYEALPARAFVTNLDAEGCDEAPRSSVTINQFRAKRRRKPAQNGR
jgi:hypothetical protein